MRFDLATPADDAALRALLRETPMGGAIRISTEREPNFFAAGEVEGPEHQTLVARRPDGGICALATRSVRLRHVNGAPRRVAYLGSLRLADDVRGNGRLVVAGYRAMRELCEADAVALTFTSILSDNVPARRLLESGRGGLPTYSSLGEIVTVVMRVRRSNSFSGVPKGRAFATTDVEARPFGTPLNGSFQEDSHQLAPVWTREDLERSHRKRVGFCAAGVSDFAKPQAAGAVWDLRGVRQSVVRGYSPTVARWRGWINAAAAVTNRPRLPAVGEPVRAAYASPLGAGIDEVVPLLRVLHADAAARGLDYLICGFDARDPRLAAVRRAFGGREFRSTLYAVRWQCTCVELSGLLQPDVATL